MLPGSIVPGRETRDAIADQPLVGHAERDVVANRFIPGTVQNNSLEISAFWHNFRPP
jgi:hypothetical protein